MTPCYMLLQEGLFVAKQQITYEDRCTWYVLTAKFTLCYT